MDKIVAGEGLPEQPCRSVKESQKAFWTASRKPSSQESRAGGCGCGEREGEGGGNVVEEGKVPDMDFFFSSS